MNIHIHNEQQKPLWNKYTTLLTNNFSNRRNAAINKTKHKSFQGFPGRRKLFCYNTFESCNSSGDVSPIVNSFASFALWKEVNTLITVPQSLSQFESTYFLAKPKGVKFPRLSFWQQSRKMFPLSQLILTPFSWRAPGLARATWAKQMQ